MELREQVLHLSLREASGHALHSGQKPPWLCPRAGERSVGGVYGSIACGAVMRMLGVVDPMFLVRAG